VLDSAPVEAALTPDNAVALKLESGTDAFAQFSVFYPVLILPSVYFIGDNGTPLEVVGGHQEVDAFLQRTRNAFAMFDGGTTTNVTTTAPEMAAPDVTTTATTSTTTVSAEDSITPVAAASAPTITADPDVAAGAADAASSSAPLEDRVLTAKEKIEAQNRERIERENEETKKRELERRKLGQEMAEAQRLKEEAAMRQRAEALAKEKADEKKARENIKAQIERDRKERQAKFEEEKRAKEQKIREKVEEKQAVEAAAAAALQERLRSVSRIQFRLPDGGAITREFPVDGAFADLRLFIADELRQQRRGIEDFDLVHSFTRRQFSPEDAASTLTQLDLAGPNALIVVPRRGAGSGAGSAGSGGAKDDSFSLVALFWLILAPFLFLFNLLRDSIFGSTTTTTTTPDAAEATRGTSRTAASTTTSSSSVTKDGERSEGVRHRANREGNIHRLRHDSDSDSDDPTWNGNSTQQL